MAYLPCNIDGSAEEVTLLWENTYYVNNDTSTTTAKYAPGSITLSDEISNYDYIEVETFGYGNDSSSGRWNNSRSIIIPARYKVTDLLKLPTGIPSSATQRKRYAQLPFFSRDFFGSGSGSFFLYEDSVRTYCINTNKKTLSNNEVITSATEPTVAARSCIACPIRIKGIKSS